MRDMSFPAYFKYVNEAGRVTPRSLLDTQAVILTILEAQEKMNDENKENFANIEEVLTKLVNKKVELAEPMEPTKSLDTEEFTKNATEPPFVCPDCQKEFKSQLGLTGHSATHKKK